MVEAGRKLNGPPGGMVGSHVDGPLERIRNSKHSIGTRLETLKKKLQVATGKSAGRSGGVGLRSAVAQMRAAAEQRTRDMLNRVNIYMRPVELDYEKDVVPLTPKGNATERHLCEAFERKAGEVFPDAARRVAFWQEKLGEN